ncbi:MAG: hypothetical protein JWM89_491 [Acidimicrobiales bacterium]|nr:hypothetical protein [Acidimicrobiales bacterium]
MIPRAVPGARLAGVALVLLVGCLVAAQSLVSALGPEGISATGRHARVDPGIDDVGRPPLVRPVGFSGPSNATVEPSTGSADATQQWYAGGRWWALLADPDSGGFHIWGLGGSGGPWIDTGVTVDERSNARSDVLWTGSHLYVVSSGGRSYRSEAARVARFSLDAAAQRWSLDPDFPVAVTDGGIDSPVIAAAPDGAVWIVYQIAGGGLRSISSTSDGLVWSAPAVVPGPASLLPTSGFGLTADAAGIAIVWRSRTTDTLRVTTHRGPVDGGTWDTVSTTVYGLGGEGPISVRPGGTVAPGALLATASLTLAKRSSSSLVPSIALLVIQPDGHTSVRVVSRASDGLTEPRLVIDDARRRAIVVAGSEDGLGAIYVKEAEAPDLQFEPGRGEARVRQPVVGPVGRPTVPDQVLDQRSGLLLLATATLGRRYVAGLVPLGGTPKISPYVAATSGGPVTLVHDSFDERPLGAPAPASWYVRGRTGSHSTTTALDRGARAMEIDVDRSGRGRERCRDLPPPGDGIITVTADVLVRGGGGADAHLLTVRGSGGALLSARLSRRGDIGWLAAQGHRRSAGASTGSLLRVVARLDPAQRTYRLSVSDAATGAVALDLPDTPWLDGSDTVVEAVCVTPPGGPPGTAILVDDLQVVVG